jgi:hypothetical protein
MGFQLRAGGEGDRNISNLVRDRVQSITTSYIIAYLRYQVAENTSKIAAIRMRSIFSISNDINIHASIRRLVGPCRISTRHVGLGNSQFPILRNFVSPHHHWPGATPRTEVRSLSTAYWRRFSEWVSIRSITDTVFIRRRHSVHLQARNQTPQKSEAAAILHMYANFTPKASGKPNEDLSSRSVM